jgi:hypothetical protein
MDKRHVHHIWTKVRRIRVWHLFVACLLFATLTIFALRSNNLTMVHLRNNVYQADKDNGDVTGTLQKLRSYVYAHMNTNLENGAGSVYPPIQLKYTYERLQKAAQADADAANSSVYTDAQHYCEQLYPDSFSGGPRVPCIENYVSTHGVKPKTIPDSMYKFAFVSPTWSPDLAGWSLVITFVLFLLLIIRVAIWLFVKKYAS